MANAQNPPEVTQAWLYDQYGAAISLSNALPIEVTGQGTTALNPLYVTGPGSGGAGAVTVADGADVTQGAKADSAANNSTSSWSLVALLKGIYALLAGVLSSALQAVTTGGCTPYPYTSAGSSNQDSTVVKSGAGQLYSITLINLVAALRYVQFYDQYAGVSPVSTDTPLFTMPVPCNNSTGAGITASYTIGFAFPHNIAFRITTGLAGSSTGAASAGDVVMILGYK